MRKRILAVVLTLLVFVVLYGGARAFLLSDVLHRYEDQAAEHDADLVATLLDERRLAGGQVTQELLERVVHEGESIEYVASDGTTSRVGYPPADASPDDVVAVRALPDGGTLTLRRSGALVRDRVGDAFLPLALFGLALGVVAALVIRTMTARLSRPFLRLAEIADGIGRGELDVTIPHFRVAEAEAIGGSMRRGVARLAELRRREHDIAINASHELRSPISALRIGIEDLASWPQTPPDVAAELTSYLPELDRLSTAVRTYLDEAEAQRLMDVDVVDLSALVRRTVAGWHARLPAGGPRIVLVDEPSGPLHVCAPDSLVADVLDPLLQDAVDRRPTHILVQLDCPEGYGRIRLDLEGTDVPADPAMHAAAGQGAMAVGGRVSTVDGRTIVMLRRAGERSGTSTATPAPGSAPHTP